MTAPPIRIPESFPDPGDVKGRRVVVTGASRGLGRLIATAFARAGARVALVARDADALEEVAADLGGDALACPADVSDPSGNDSVVDRVVTAWGGLDVWVANAGISPIVASAVDTPPEVFRRVVDVNLNGVFYGARAALQAMADGEGGAIIVTASVCGERPRRGLAAYSASKGGVIALVKALALDAAPLGVTVNAVSPGWFDSPLAAGWQANPDLADTILGHVALGRWGRSEDLTGAYLFLASDAARFVTGAVVAVDGGYLCL
ncbi:MAG: SDR family NAD(P)-dependent oxidoreductase [Actinomycetota bacterium]